jgi:hypothetical protein
MKMLTQNSMRRNKITVGMIAVTVFAASLLSAVAISKADAKSAGGEVHMAGSAASKTQAQIGRADSVQAPRPTSVKEPCKPSPHCRPPHDHTH